MSNKLKEDQWWNRADGSYVWSEVDEQTMPHPVSADEAPFDCVSAEFAKSLEHRLARALSQRDALASRHNEEMIKRYEERYRLEDRIEELERRVAELQGLR